MKGIRTKLTLPLLTLLSLLFAISVPCAFAQESNPLDSNRPSEEAVPAQLAGEALVAYLNSQLELLDSPEFRTRQLAESRLQQYPEAAIELIAKSAPIASLNSASQQISLLDYFHSHPNTEIKSHAYNTLKGLSLTKTTALASLAASSIKGIEDDLERQAFDILTHAGADIGYLDININGSKSSIRSDVLGVEINSDRFTGTVDTLSWIRYLKSIKIVSLEGKCVTAEALALVAQMAGVNKILLRGTYIRPGYYETQLRPSDLLVLRNVPEIQHFEIKYMSIDDSFVPALCQLPITESLRLFGTNISEEGKDTIAQQLDGLEIYRGKGGFLGIGSLPTGQVQVTQVQERSAAQNAGIQERDIILEIEGTPIKNFAGLRATLANYGPSELLLIKLRRANPQYTVWLRNQRRLELNPDFNSDLNPEPKPIEYFEHLLFVVLNEQAN